ncbi:hypothetical protein Pfo_024705 [Paulownia fortunei]|nr:hypothetical protein Pfo_024705 [Paulownia fortunei]
MESSDRSQDDYLYKEWMSMQEQELYELLQYLNINNTATHDAEMTALLEKIIQHFQDYIDRRHHLARHDISAFFSPSWCTTLENSMSWIAGRRPSSFFSLIFALCGLDIDSRLSQFFRDGSYCDFPQLSASQLSSIDNLQRRTILEEEKLTTQMASLRQDMTDMPLALLARKSAANSIAT